jgi:hypothetical protein
MWKLLIHSDLQSWPKHLFLFCLLVFPALAYTVTRPAIGITPYMALGIICVTFLIYRLIEIYRKGENLIVPTYIVLFGLFTGYTLYCHMFVSDYFEERGIKLFFSDSVWLSFLAMIVVENIKFSEKVIFFAQKVLIILLVLASLVSLIQITNPLFMVNDQLLVQGLSYDRMAEYYQGGTQGLSKGQIGYIQRFMEGYKLSIFSYINGISVGMDTLAIFSVLIAWNPLRVSTRGFVAVAAAIISFLSSSRWIILGFFIVASQHFLVGRNKIKRLLYFVIFGVTMILILALGASLLGFDVEQYVTQRLLSDSASTRLLAFEVFGKVFPDNPILGTGGVDTTEMVRLLGGQSSQIHVGFLKLFYYYGLLGGALYIAFMFSFMIRLWKRARSSGYWGGFFAILSFFAANLTLFELSIFYFGPLLALIFANHFYANKKKEGDAVKQKENEIYSSLKIKFNG